MTAAAEDVGAGLNGDDKGIQVDGWVSEAISELLSDVQGWMAIDDGAGMNGPDAPTTREGWLSFLTRSSSLKQFGIALAWGAKAGFLLCSPSCARPPRTPSRAKRSGCLYPLPVSWPEDFSSLWGSKYETSCTDFAVECWVTCCCISLNSLYGLPGQGCHRRPGKVHVAALNLLRDKVRRFLDGELPVSFSFEDVVRDLKEKRTSYTGEEISQPYALTRVQILKSLPPEGHGGSIPVTNFLVGRTKFLIENPLENLVPVRDRERGPMQAKVHIERGQELEVFKLLEERGVTTWIPADQVYSDEMGPCLNGMFGVVKPNKFTPCNKPILRVIMNLVPANRCLEVIRGDIQLLPHGTSWLPLIVSEGEELRVSQGDMSAAFYLFEIPSMWQQFMSFNYVTKGENIQRAAGQLWRPCCRVLPMGWNSSVGVMQMISREILLSQGVPASLELHKGKSVPRWFSKIAERASPQTAWWQVYLDNFMSAERVEEQYQETDVSLQAMAMGAWHGTGVLTADDKQVLGSNLAVELGVRLDGERGLLGASAERVYRTSLATLQVLLKSATSQKEAQIILGRWIFILQYRRAGMGVLSQAWNALEGSWPTARQRHVLMRELEMLLCLGPLLQTDLRCEYEETVTCSDASQTGGAAACSSGLSWSGRTLVRALRDPQLKAISCPILLVSVFNGVGGAFRVYDVLGILPCARISIENYRDANRVSRTSWPDMEEIHDVQSVTRAEIRKWANMWPRVREVHIMAGFPCVHLSRVRAYRKNLQGEGSKLFWNLIDIISWIKEAFEPRVKVKYVIENVASMDDSARKEISAVLDIQPLKVDPADTLPYNRPRLAWCSEEFYAMDGLRLYPEKDYVRVEVLEGQVSDHQWMRPGWSRVDDSGQTNFPTFMKSIPREVPPPFPAGLNKCDWETRQRWESDSFRFPPYQYCRKYLLQHPTKGMRLLDSSERELLLGFGPGHTASCRSASEAKQNMTAYEDSRKSLCGDSYAIPSFALLGAVLCSEMVPRMPPSQIIQRLGLAPGASAHPNLQIPMTRWLAYSDSDAGQPAPVELVKTTADRKRRRAGIRLRDYTIAAKTRIRYESAVARVLPFLEAQPSLHDLDGVLTDWIELQWTKGEPLTYIADALSGLHFFWPEVRGLLRQAWRTFRSWRRIEAPCRAPPLTLALARAFVAKAVADNCLALATLIALGFHGLLRTGELLSLQFQHIEHNAECGVISLPYSKSGQRSGAHEAVAIRDSLTLQLLETLVSVQSPCDPYHLDMSGGLNCLFRRVLRMGPTLIQHFGMSQLQFGTLTTAFAVAKLCGNIPSSIFSEAYGRKALLVGGLMSIGTGIAGVAFASGYEHLMILRLAVGLGVASTFTSAGACEGTAHSEGMYVTDISHPLNSARTRAPMQMGMSAGLLIGPAIGGYLLEHIGLDAHCVFALLPETHKRRPGERLRGVSDTLRSWSPILALKPFREILSFGWCYNAAFWGESWLSTANAIVSLSVTPLVAKTADRFGKMAVVFPGAVLYGASLMLVPHVSSLIELLPVKDRAKVPSLWATFGDTGMLLSSFTAAMMAENLGLGSAFTSSGVLLVGAAGMMFYVAPTTSIRGNVVHGLTAKAVAMFFLRCALRCGWKDHSREPWNAALAALALLSPKQKRKALPHQRNEALEQLWRNQASLQTPKHFAQAISAFGRHRRWQEGNLLLDEMTRRKLGPCKYSYSALLSACAAASAWQKAMQLLSYQDAGFELDLIALSSALSACEKASHWEQALLLCAEAERRKIHLDLVAFNTVISSCGKGFAWQTALGFLELCERKQRPDVVSFSAAVSACERGQQWQRALHLLSTARQQGNRLDAILLGASVSACEKGRQWEHALSLLAQATGLYEAMISCDRGCDIGLALQHSLAEFLVQRYSFS
eukprot:s3055_g7.t2